MNKMNIFILDKNPVLCAKYHNDKHVVKMITETAQLLNNTYYITDELHKIGTKKNGDKYGLTHQHHPCAKWVNKNLSNWIWLHELGVALYNEYKIRYGKDKTHHSGEVILGLELPNIEDFGLDDFAIGFKDEIQEKYKDYKDNIVEMYRQYYMGEKRYYSVKKKIYNYDENGVKTKDYHIEEQKCLNTWKTEKPSWFI